MQESFQALFQFKALVFAEEIGSILLTPLMLWHSLAGCSGALDVLQNDLLRRACADSAELGAARQARVIPRVPHPTRAGAIIHFLRDNTEFVEGIGDVCSMAAFAFPRHGNAHYGSAYDAPKVGSEWSGWSSQTVLLDGGGVPAFLTRHHNLIL